MATAPRRQRIDLRDQSCSAVLVVTTKATILWRTHDPMTMPTHPIKPRACACWLEVGIGPPQAFDKRAYGGCCCWPVNLRHLQWPPTGTISNPTFLLLWGPFLPLEGSFSSSGAELAIPLGGFAFPLGFTIGQLWDIGRLFPRSLGFALDPARALLSPPIPSNPSFYISDRQGWSYFPPTPGHKCHSETYVLAYHL